jgi:serine/threonine protein kinase
METQINPTKICIICGAHNSISNIECTECNSNFQNNPSILKCSFCKFSNNYGAKYCSNCGTTIIDPLKENDSDFIILSNLLRNEFNIENLIGEGGMGRVFRGNQLNLNKKVAIKILRNEYSGNKDVIERFKNEALILAKLKSPYIIDIINIYDIQGRPFYIMNYIPGSSLSNKINELKLSKPNTVTIISIMIKLLNALKIAHREGIFHRDIKPHNILIDQENNPYLIDFGISKVKSQEGFTMEGITLGTPGYMSPEQLEGHEIDARTDIYSSGILLFEMLTGKLPFEFDNIPQLIKVQLSEPFPQLSNFLESNLAQLFQPILEKACSKDINLRYNSTEEMEIELNKIISEFCYKPSSNSINITIPKIKSSVLQELIYTPFSLQLRLINPGAFDMGALLKDKDSKLNEKPRVKIKIEHPFYVSTTPITQKVYQEITGKKPSKFDNPDAPVENMSYIDALKFIDLINNNTKYSFGNEIPGIYRLPTEIEWEYFARGGSNYIYTFGDDKYQLDNYAYYSENSGNTTHSVAEKKPNSLGIYDLMGNVWEWCQDYYDNEFHEKRAEDNSYYPKNGKYRVVRGGSFKDPSVSLRLSARKGFLLEEKTEYIGFRIIYELK